MVFGLKRFRGTFSWRDARVLAISFVVTLVVTLITNRMYINITPNLALGPVIGLLFGPFGALGVNLVSFMDNMHSGIPLAFCLLDLVTTFVVSYIPYRIWYSSLNSNGCRRPILDSVSNVSKFILVLVISSLTYAVLYKLTYGLLDGSFQPSYEDVLLLINVISFSPLFGFTLVIVFRYFRIPLSSPRAGGTPDDDVRRRINPTAFNLALIAGMIFPMAILFLIPSRDIVPITTIITYMLFALFLLKPVDAADCENDTCSGKMYRFNNSLIERIIVIFLIMALTIGIIATILAYTGILNDFGWGRLSVIPFYIGASLISFFVPMLLFLWYVERKVSRPLTEISRAARHFISDEDMATNAEVATEVYETYVSEDSEIGDLAMSLTKMTGDMESYVEDIRALNSKQERLLAELSIAESIQDSFIPKDFDSVRSMGVDLYGSMSAAKFVGGDLYDFFMVDDHHLAFVIADVSGKGVPAALFMAVAKSLLEGHASSGLDPNEILGAVNNGVCKNNDMDMFITAWMGILDVRTGIIRFANAGHNPPVMKRLGEPAILLRTKPGLVLGAMHDVDYRCFEETLHPGDRLFLYTDGVTEANDDYKEFYGEERLLQRIDSMCDAPIRDVVEYVKSDVLGFMGESEQFDDVTMLFLEYGGEDSGT